MIKALSSLGAANDIHLVASYHDGNVSVTCSILPKDEKQREKSARVIQISGPIDEVEAEIAKVLTATAESVVKFQTNLAAIEAENQKQLDEARAKAPKPAEKKPAKKEKVEPKPEPASEPPPAAPAAEAGGLDLANLIAEANAKK